MPSTEYEAGIGGTHVIQNSIELKAFEIDYPFVPCEGNPFQRADNGDSITLSELASLLNDPESQGDAFDALGVNIDGNVLEVKFLERGKAYVDEGDNRGEAEDEESSMSFNFDIHFIRNISLPLRLTVDVSGFFQENVNFLGQIIVRDEYVLPLTGRGTAALEGRPNDCHAGYCTGGACASFQQRAALILAIALAAGARVRDLRKLSLEFAAVDAKYHGRREILDYTLQCCINSMGEMESYRSFMSKRGGVSNVMEPLINEPNAIPEPEYFHKLRSKLSEPELRSRAPTMRPAVEESIYPLIPRAPVLPGNVSLSELADMLSSRSRQSEALQILGFEIEDSHIELTFSESGHEYSKPNMDRQLVEEAVTNAKFQIGISRIVKDEEDDEEKKEHLPIEVELDGWIQNKVNFLGMVQVTVDNAVYMVPLTGRGTAALEGRRRDAHAGFCTGNACASFQIRAALCLAVIRAIGADDDEIKDLGEQLHTLNKMFHGRGDILDYTIHCALTPNAESYLDFMSSRYAPDDNRFPLLQAMRTTGRPNRGYFEAVLNKFTPEELDDERERRGRNHDEPWWWRWSCCRFF